MIKDVCYAEFACPDLSEAKHFLIDFGFVPTLEESDRIFFRGAESRPYIFIIRRGEEARILETGYTVDSEETLRSMAARLGGLVESADDNPWGGLRAKVKDCDGNTVVLLWNVRQLEPLKLAREEVKFNSGGIIRREGRLPVFGEVPPPVFHLCHVVHSSDDPTRFIEWYRDNLGAYPSDLLMGGEEPILAFMRFPDGKKYVPHHSVAVFNGKRNGVQHICFESLDVDAVFHGHRYLKSRGYKSSWGPLRHTVGGAISDYWHTPFGLRIEHVTDGDVLNDQFETGIQPMNDKTAYQWTTHAMPADFGDH
jgi:catechol 2,3-dioxygenase-like lactoylglutathione lyase family enzyme